MDGIIIIDKPKGYTSRDVVNIVGKTFHTKKVGHTGTLDPLATGVLVICVNKATKLVEILTSLDKEYIAEFEFGTLTDTLDCTGKVIKSEKTHIDEAVLKETLNSMIGKYSQTVPLYSAIKVDGKKLYEYARNGEDVELPIHDVNILGLELLSINYLNDKTIAKIKCHVSKGTYIRSLGNDIANKLNTYAIMTELRRTKQGEFKIEDSIKLEDLKEDTTLKTISECLNNYYKVLVNSNLMNDIKNGRSVPNIYNKDYVLFINEENEALALYASLEDKKVLKPWKMFKI